MTGHDLEPREEFPPGSLTPMYGPSTPTAAHAGQTSALDRFMSVGTPRTPGKDFFAQMDNAWFYISYGPRFVLKTLMVVLFRWYYFSGIVVTLWFIRLLLTSDS